MNQKASVTRKLLLQQMVANQTNNGVAIKPTPSEQQLCEGLADMWIEKELLWHNAVSRVRFMVAGQN